MRSCAHVERSAVGRSDERSGEGGPADLLPGNQAVTLIEGQPVDGFSQPRHTNTRHFTASSCGLQKQQVEALACVCSVLHRSELAKPAMPQFALFYHPG